MRYRRHQNAGAKTDWDLVVDGNGYVIAAWSQQLHRDLPVVAEGFVGSGEGRIARSVAESLVARWTDWCVGESENTMISSTGNDTGRFFWPVIEVPIPPDPLEPRLAISDDLVGRWIVGNLPEEVAIEELHTSVEGLLRRLLGVGKGPNWPTLLTKARSSGYISETDGGILTSFNTLYRNRLKHQAEALIDDEREAASQTMWMVLGICEGLLQKMA
jgi:hypothetical protein